MFIDERFLTYIMMKIIIIKIMNNTADILINIFDVFSEIVLTDVVTSLTILPRSI
jgi:hypothetical protein